MESSVACIVGVIFLILAYFCFQRVARSSAGPVAMIEWAAGIRKETQTWRPKTFRVAAIFVIPVAIIHPLELIAGWAMLGAIAFGMRGVIAALNRSIVLPRIASWAGAAAGLGVMGVAIVARAYDAWAGPAAAAILVFFVSFIFGRKLKDPAQSVLMIALALSGSAFAAAVISPLLAIIPIVFIPIRLRALAASFK